jgi:hypothetical protein|tara:strand:+ start:67 stop:273 length:207 start_codon:yes stop_codon:yes gene_type:complete
MYKETKKRTLFKTVSWRFVAVLNSFLVLTVNITDNNFWNAVYMNITGFLIYYVFERIWNRIDYGKEKL